MYIDVHAHLDHQKYFGDLDKVVTNCRKNNVIVISAGVNKDSNRKVLEISQKYNDTIKAALGMFPFDALGNSRDTSYSGTIPTKFDVDEELEFIKKNKDKIIAISEVGLDKSIPDHHIEKQKEIFFKIISLSEQIRKPLIVHSREAELECVEALESCNHKNIVMHMFSGNFKLVKRITDNEWNFSIPVKIDRLQHFQSIAQQVSINKLLTETDSPWAPPKNIERNEPMYIIDIIKKISEIKNLNEIDVQKNIFKNFKKLFLKNE